VISHAISEREDDNSKEANTRKENKGGYYELNDHRKFNIELAKILLRSRRRKLDEIKEIESTLIKLSKEYALNLNFNTDTVTECEPCQRSKQ